MNSSLPERLKIATRQLHTAAERSAFMAALLRGQLGIRSYRELLLNLHAIYVALESELERHRANPAVAAVWIDGIARAPSLALDLATMPCNSALIDPGLRPSVVAYVSRLREIGRERPVLLVAHAYVRYLGDLSGGQTLRRIVGESLKAPTAFYDFGPPERAQQLRMAFRLGLEQMNVEDALAEAIVQEAIGAFGRHVALFEELLASAPVQ